MTYTQIKLNSREYTNLKLYETWNNLINEFINELHYFNNEVSYEDLKDICYHQKKYNVNYCMNTYNLNMFHANDMKNMIKGYVEKLDNIYMDIDHRVESKDIPKEVYNYIDNIKIIPSSMSLMI